MTAMALLRACPQRNGCPLVSPPDLRRLDFAPRLKTVALAATASVLLHLGAMAALSPREMALIAGGGETAPAALGTSFADFTEGALSPSEAEPLQAMPPAPTLPDRSPPPVTPHMPESALPAVALPLLPQSSTALFPAAPPLVAPAALPEEVARPPLDVAAIPPQYLATPTPPNAVSPDTKLDTGPNTGPTDLAPKSSQKPPPRPDNTPRMQPTAPAQAPQGNAPQTATRGSQQGAQGQSANQERARPQDSAQGNAAASNYPGEVLRRIQRTRQARSPARGQVLVAFSLASDGALISVSVARTSGHAGLDQIALDHIRRAAPFPPAPAGAQRQFSFEFVGR
jgi:protein TonB